jgi:hypothetical protein
MHVRQWPLPSIPAERISAGGFPAPAPGRGGAFCGGSRVGCGRRADVLLFSDDARYVTVNKRDSTLSIADWLASNSKAAPGSFLFPRSQPVRPFRDSNPHPRESLAKALPHEVAPDLTAAERTWSPVKVTLPRLLDVSQARYDYANGRKIS